MLLPAVHPSSQSPLPETLKITLRLDRPAATRSSIAIRRPRAVGCCARAASGHAATAPPISVMNSRRLMGCAPRPGITG
jgi:hypothetical protein